MLVKSKKIIVSSALFLSVFILFQFLSNKSYAFALSKDQYNINDLKILTGEEITKQDGVYTLNICNNENKAEIILDIENMEQISDDQCLEYMNNLIATGEDNTIVGKIECNDDIIMTVNLNEGSNLVKIKNKKDNSEVLRLNINYKKVKVLGIPDNINVGDNFNLKSSIDKEIYNNIKWSSYGIDTLMVSEDGNVTIVNGGIGRMIGTIYKDNKIIGSINISIYALGKGKLGWIKNGHKWYYIDPVKKHLKIGWLESNNNWYYMNNDGSMRTGWLNDHNHTYYLNDKGEMVKDKINIEGKEYIFNNKGELLYVK